MDFAIREYTKSIKKEKKYERLSYLWIVKRDN